MRLWIALSLSLAFAGAAAAAEIKGASRIDAVTVYPAGAEIVRTARVKLEPGEHTLLFADLPAETVAASIRVEGKATGRLEIGAVDTRSVSVPRTDEAAVASERRKVEEAIETLKDEKAALQVAVQAAETQKKLIESLTKLPTRPVPAGGAAPAQPDWGQVFELIGKRTAEAQQAILDTGLKVREVDRKIRDLQGKLASLAPIKDRRTEVKVFVTAGEALEADVVIRYQVRSASWTPFYDARLSSGTKAEAPRLQLVRRAAIRQSTGEAWDKVALSLSTARPTAGTAAPTLQPLIIDYEVDRPPPPTALAQPRRERGFHKEGPAAGDEEAADKTVNRDQRLLRFGAARKFDTAETQAKVEVQAFQAVYGIPGRVTVPETGETKRVQIDEMKLEPALIVRTVPKLQDKAYLYAKIATASGSPLLPGQVSLFRDAVFVGNGRLPLLGPGEAHELGFGVDDAVRVKYTIAEEKRSESGIISTSKTDSRSYRITVKNLHERAIQVSVLDHMPVSQHADIKVELTGKTAPARRDVEGKRGVLAWDLQLAPAEERAIDFGYRATWPAAKKVTYGQGS
jgi:uncharacterized protein (TIGR02231 family)